MAIAAIRPSAFQAYLFQALTQLGITACVRDVKIVLSMGDAVSLDLTVLPTCSQIKEMGQVLARIPSDSWKYMLGGKTFPGKEVGQVLGIPGGIRDFHLDVSQKDVVQVRVNRLVERQEWPILFGCLARVEENPLLPEAMPEAFLPLDLTSEELTALDEDSRSQRTISGEEALWILARHGLVDLDRATETVRQKRAAVSV